MVIYIRSIEAEIYAGVWPLITGVSLNLVLKTREN